MAFESQVGFLEIDGASIFHETAGSGHALVLVHSGITDCRMWDEQVPRFARELGVVRYDMRGFGRSSIPVADYSHAEDLSALLNRLDLENAILVGASYGGNVAVELALLHPEQLGALILVNTLAGMSEPSDALRQGWRETEALLEADELDGAVECELRMWVDGPHRTPGEVDSVFRERVRQMDAALFARYEEQELATELELAPPAIDRLDEIEIPTLIVVGSLDMPDALASAGSLASGIANAKHVEIPGVAHLPSMEDPEVFNTIVLDFIDSLRLPQS